MKREFVGVVGGLVMMVVGSGVRGEVVSPDGRVGVAFSVEGGKPVYGVRVGKEGVVLSSRMGVVREDEDFTQGMVMEGDGPTVEKVDEHYEMLTGKRRENHYVAGRYSYHLRSAGGKRMDVVFQVSNDGVAFRYVFPGTDEEVKKIKSEGTTFRFPAGTVGWMQPMQVAKSGWMESNPAYEEYYQKGVAMGTKSPLGAGWVYPALFKTGENWVAVSEAGVGRSYCGTHLSEGVRGEHGEGEYGVALADVREVKDGGPALPEGKGTWASPWRVICVGSLKVVAESTLGTDVAEKPEEKLAAMVKGFAVPGKASWSWPLLGDKNTTYEVQKEFIDYAAEMGWGYCLIDALWDKQIGYEKVKELCAYGAGKKVGVWVWYNSAGDWNTTPQTPRGKLLTHEMRVSEFAKLKEMGVKGIKVDFFGGDGQSFMNYYQDILEDAAGYGLMVNFHGATLPRGWERTYPHLMTMEAIRGFEYCTFEQANADQEPTHAAMLPFTRNLFDPMDFTPVCLDKISERVQRRTSSGFEMALSVLFTSGVQHYVETPAGMGKMPAYVKEFLRGVPSVWEDSRLIEGYPGKYVVMARRGGGKWFVAGINGEEAERVMVLDLGELGVKQGRVIGDGKERALFEERPVVVTGGKVEVVVKGRGGFVMAME